MVGGSRESSGVEEVEQTEQLTEVVVQRCSSQQNAVDGVELLEATDKEPLVILDCLSFIDNQNFPARYAAEGAELVGVGDGVVGGEHNMSFQSLCPVFVARVIEFVLQDDLAS